MRVRMKVDITGFRGGDRWPPRGGELDVDDREGADLCAQGYAEPVAVAPEARAEKRPAAKKSEKRSK